MNHHHDIIHLPKEQWEGTTIPMRYTTDQYYDVTVSETGDGYGVKLEKRRFKEPVSHYPEEYDFPDKLYQPYWEKACAWGIVADGENGKELFACIETCPEEWSNRLIVTELWVHEDFRRQGIGHELMAVAKEQAVLEHRRAVILETQSCNVGAIAFYQKEGFELAGFDSCCYSNRDPERKEVRIDMAYLLRRKGPKAGETVVIREEQKDEYRRTEQMVLRAFWNKYRMGCDEHLLVHRLREDAAYLPGLSRVAVDGDQIVGAIFYAQATLRREQEEKKALLFGPLCVAPEWQGCGVGTRLLRETIGLSRKAGYVGIIICGEPDYYPRHGFVTCDRFGITTADGKNFDAFMGLELAEGGLHLPGARFYEPEVYENLSEQENERFTEQFDTPRKQYFPGQWK